MVLWPVCKLLVEKQGLSHILCQRQAIPPRSAVSLQDQPSCIPVGGSGRLRPHVCFSSPAWCGLCDGKKSSEEVGVQD